MLGERRARRLRGDAAIAHRLADTRQAFEEFAYIVAHDLNAPLRNIVNFSQLLEERCHDALDEKGLHYVDRIADSCHKAQTRLAGLLQYSRLDTVPLQVKPLESKSALDHALHQLRDDIEEREASIHARPLPELTADFDRLALLFYCLLSNALKFCRGRPSIDIAAHRGHEAWIFSVCDNGIGIDPKDHATIFGVFHRLHGDEEYEGAGMGLALAHRIAELHGGDLWVESALDRGAAFYFSLPDRIPEASTA